MEKHYLAYEFDSSTLENGQTNADFFCHIPISSNIYKLTLLQADLHLGNDTIIDENQYYVYKKQLFNKLPQIQPLKDYYFKINFINYLPFLKQILKALYMVSLTRIFTIKINRFKLDNLSYIFIYNISKSTLTFIVKKPYAYSYVDVENWFNKYYNILFRKNYDTTISMVFEANHVNTSTCQRIFTNKLLEKNLKLSNNSYRIACLEYNIIENNQLNEEFSLSQIELICQDFETHNKLLKYNTDSSIHLCRMEYIDKENYIFENSDVYGLHKIKRTDPLFKNKIYFSFNDIVKSVNLDKIEKYFYIIHKFYNDQNNDFQKIYVKMNYYDFFNAYNIKLIQSLYVYNCRLIYEEFSVIRKKIAVQTVLSYAYILFNINKNILDVFIPYYNSDTEFKKIYNLYDEQKNKTKKLFKPWFTSSEQLASNHHFHFKYNGIKNDIYLHLISFLDQIDTNTKDKYIKVFAYNDISKSDYNKIDALFEIYDVSKDLYIKNSIDIIKFQNDTNLLSSSEITFDEYKKSNNINKVNVESDTKPIIKPEIDLKNYFIKLYNQYNYLTENINFKLNKNQYMFIDDESNTINISIFRNNGLKLEINNNFILVIKFELEKYGK